MHSFLAKGKTPVSVPFPRYRLADQLIAGEPVTVERTNKEQIRRIVGKIVHDGEDLCLKQVRSGYAWQEKKYQRE